MAKFAAHIDFIVQKLRLGQKRGEILAEFVLKWPKVSERTFNRRLFEAEKVIEAEIALLQGQVKESIVKEAERVTGQILTVSERLVILSNIAKGDLYIERPISTRLGIEMVPCPPDHGERKAAIAELNKMDGAYAPAKQEVTVSEKPTDLSKLNDEELRLLAELQSKSGTSEA